jgi:hypothetical protein
MFDFHYLANDKINTFLKEADKARLIKKATQTKSKNSTRFSKPLYLHSFFTKKVKHG